MVLLTAVALSVTIGALYYYFTRTFNYWKDRNVPGPKPVPFFGNLSKSALRYVKISNIYKEIYNSYSTEKVVGVFRMTTPCLLIRDLDIVKHVLIKDFDIFLDRGVELSNNGFGTNLLHAEGKIWRGLRGIMSPMFTNQKLKNMMHLLNDRADKFVDYINGISAETPEHDIFALVKKYTMSTITACAFSLDVDTFYGDIQILHRIDQAIFRPKFATELNMMYPGILKKLNISPFPGYMKKFFKDLVETVITERKGVPSTRKDFMDLMLEMKNKRDLEALKNLCDENVKTVDITKSLMEAQAFTVFAGGYETSASTLGFLLYHLALDPEIQDKLRNEIDEYLQKHSDQIDLDTLNELTYLEKVFNETLRMYPIASNLHRKAQDAYVCPDTNVKVAKDQILVISVLGIHRDEKYYPEPEKFNPDNFAPENVATRHSCAYLPFGLGPRRCIGIRFAQAQSRVCVIRLLSKFRLEAGKNTARSFSFNPYRVTLSPNKTIYLNIYPRDNL